MEKLLATLLILIQLSLPVFSQNEPFKLAIAGLKHGHANGFLRDLQKRNDVALVGIWEEDHELSQKITDRFQIPDNLVFHSLQQMIKTGKPEAVAIFSSTYDHLEIVKTCAALKTPVMMEKPMAINTDHARKMIEVAENAGIDLVVNYETTWYPTNHLAKKQLQYKDIGDIRKIVVHSGHMGPKEIGVGPDFLEWLTDPVLNGGGGALMDFGCYGANLMTWLMNNQKPTTVFAVTQTIKPETYPRVDDEATIVLTYPKAQGIIQASWNWPFSVKDMQVYFKNGTYIAKNRFDYQLHQHNQDVKNETLTLQYLEYDNPIEYLKNVVRGKIKNEGLSSPENNLIVMEILDAAKESAKKGKIINLR